MYQALLVAALRLGGPSDRVALTTAQLASHVHRPYRWVCRGLQLLSHYGYVFTVDVDADADADGASVVRLFCLRVPGAAALAEAAEELPPPPVREVFPVERIAARREALLVSGSVDLPSSEAAAASAPAPDPGADAPPEGAADLAADRPDDGPALNPAGDAPVAHPADDAPVAHGSDDGAAADASGDGDGPAAARCPTCGTSLPAAGAAPDINVTGDQKSPPPDLHPIPPNKLMPPGRTPSHRDADKYVLRGLAATFGRPAPVVLFRGELPEGGGRPPGLKGPFVVETARDAVARRAYVREAEIYGSPMYKLLFPLTSDGIDVTLLERDGGCVILLDGDVLRELPHHIAYGGCMHGPPGVCRCKPGRPPELRRRRLRLPPGEYQDDPPLEPRWRDLS